MLIKAIHSSELEVGRNIKSTKKKFTWKFQIENIDQEIALFVSSMSGKKVVKHNGRVIHDESSYFSDFRFLHYIQRCLVTIAPKKDSYELFLDNVPFFEYYNTQGSHKNQSPQHKALKNVDNEGYDLSPLRDAEIPKQTIQPQNMKLKLTVPKEQKQVVSQPQESSKPEINWWKSGMNEFGTPSTSSNDQNENMFGKFGFTFDTPEREKQQQTQKAQNNQNNKPNPFSDQSQTFWNSLPQNKPQINQIENQQQINQFYQNSQPQQQTNNQTKQQPQIFQQQQQYNNNQNFYQNQNTLQQQFNQPQNIIKIQPQQQQRQSLPNNFQNIPIQQPQTIYQSQIIQPVQNNKVSQNVNLLDFNDEPQTVYQSQQINNYNQQSDLKKAASTNNFDIFQSNPQQNNQFNQLNSYQKPQQPQIQYRTSSSYQPTSVYQQKQQMPKELEDLFDSLDFKPQPPLQKRSTPFDDDDIFA